MNAIALGALLGLAGCLSDERPTMNPGDDCIECHRAGGQADGLRWSAAGTIFRAPDAAETDGVRDVHVLLTDALGRQVQLTTNEAGNFYTEEPLTAPIGVQLERGGATVAMDLHPTLAQIYGTVEDGGPAVNDGRGIGCNACHSGPPDADTGTTPVGGAPGRVYAPGSP